LIRLLTYLGDKEAPGTIRVIIPYLLLNKYNNILANFDFTMINAPQYFQGLNLLQVQRLATQSQYNILNDIKQKIAPKYGFKVAYDIDDLVTDVPTFNIVKKYYNDNKESIKRILSTVDYIVCSTGKLASMMDKYNKTKVIQNRLFEPVWRKVTRKSFFETGEKPKIIWAGGHTHFTKEGEEDDDFDKKIINYMSETSDRFNWIFCGHQPKEFVDNKNITFYPWTNSYFDYPQVLRDINPDIGIALLQVNDFNKCKSNLKALEYATLDIPGVYSKINPYEFMTCKVSTPDQFIEKIELLTSDQEYYEKVKAKDYNIMKDNLYWDDTYIKKYLNTYFKK